MSRALVLDALAQALSDPAIMAGAPTSSPLAEALKQVAPFLGSAACRRALFALAELPSLETEVLQHHFEALITEAQGQPLPLYESLALNGRLMGAAAQEVARIYRQYGLEPDGELPDAASVELAFLAFLVEAEAEAHLLGATAEAQRLRQEQHQFLNEHVLAWLPLVGRALSKTGEPHWVMLGHLLEDFLREEQVRVLVDDRGEKVARVPFIAEAEKCGLCGFCVQICPPAALWISENAEVTALLLTPERCLDCGKCLPVCPDHALQMVPRPANVAPTVILRESPRAHCPRCGAATVSQVELDFVLTSIEADAGMQYRLSLCGSCKGLV
ncbi:MAG: 4Fe-4S dicluster domain-containing protein [Chloroflexi bacterium]|nr:4Fe-4S dicluster domain-containing protein [Chloroflexota bacterium]